MTAAAGRRVALAALVILVAGAGVWWGIHPPRTEESYREESAKTVQVLRSTVQTARLWLDAKERGRATSAATVVALTESETDAQSRIGGYSSLQPPTHAATKVRDRVTSVGDRVVTVLGNIRIDARAGRWHDAVTARSTLDTLARRLQKLQARVEP